MTQYKLRKAHYGHDCWGAPEFSHYTYIGPFDTIEEAREMMPRNGEYEIVEISTSERVVK